MEYEKTTFEGREVEIHRNYHGDGSLNSEWTQTIYELHGFQRDYYPNGQLKAERIYRNNKKTEHDLSFYENGNKKSEVSLLKDNEFKRVSYFENGQIQSEIISNLEGKTLYHNKSWHQNGQLASIHEYTNTGEPIGKFYHYFEDGSVQTEGEYIKGEPHYYNVFISPGNSTICNGEGILHSSFGTKRTSLTSECVMKNGLRNGPSKTYKNGILKSETYYVNGKAEGKSIQYNPDGSVNEYVYFENGVFTKREKPE